MSSSKRKRLNILVSYAYIRKNEYIKELILALSPYVNIMIDSGAHTNRQIRIKRSIGKPLPPPVMLKDYMDFLKIADGKVWQYIALDVIRNQKETDKNLKIMHAEGFRPMPVFIEGYKKKDLDRILETNQRICVAGGVGSGDAYIEKRYRDVFEMSEGRAKIHGLGYGRYPEILRQAFVSSDSSTFNTGWRYGIIFRFLQGRKIDSINWKTLADGKDTEQVKKFDFLLYLKSFGIKLDKKIMFEYFKGKDSVASIPTMISYYAYLQMMKECTEVGKDYFLAIDTHHHILGIFCCIAAEREDCQSFDYEKARALCLKHTKFKDVAMQFILDTAKETQWKMLPQSK